MKGMNAKDFVLDVWNDLRAERLWPVALLLLVALVAIPLVVLKPAEEAPPPPIPSAATSNPTLDGPREVMAALNSKPLVRVSSLDQFSSKNPFKPLDSIKELEDAAGVEPETTDPSGAESASTGGAGGAGGTGDASGGTVTPESGSGGGTPGGGSTGGDTGTGGTDKPAPTKRFTYVLNLTFTSGDKTNRYRGFKRLGMLPDEQSPLLVFLGMNAKATHAVFLVDSSLNPVGEGTCKPKPKECGFLYLEAGEEEYFTDQAGKTYTLRLDRVRKVEVGSRAAGASTASRGPTAATADGGAATPARRFVLPPLLDFEVSGQ